MQALAAILIFTGLLLAGLAPVAASRLRKGRRWSEAIGRLSLQKIAELSHDGSLAAIRGAVEAETPLEDPVTGDSVVWFEVEVHVGQATGDLMRGETAFVVRDETGAAWVDPKGARDVAVRIDDFEPEHDRGPVAGFLKKRGLSNRADVSLRHRHIPVGVEVVVVGRTGVDERTPRREPESAYRDGPAHLVSLTSGDEAELAVTTYSLEAFRERELASTKSGATGVIMLAAMGLGCAAAGALIFVL
jgi:hypothetical protein